MATPGIHLTTLHNPCLYTPAQLDRAAAIASALHRGAFILAEQPKQGQPWAS